MMLRPVPPRCCKNKNRRKQNFEDEANNIQWIKKSTNEEN